MFMATDYCCSIKRIKEVNYISKYLKTYSIYLETDLTTIGKCLFLQNMFGKLQNHFVVSYRLSLVSFTVYIQKKRKKKTNNADSCSAGFVEPVR